MITKENKILITNLWESKGYGAWRMIPEFPDKRRGTENLWSNHAHHAAVTTLLMWKNWLKVRKVKHTCICLPGGHFNHTLWLSICFLCTWWTLCFPPCLMQQLLF